MNSYLQTIYHLTALTRSVFNLPQDSEQNLVSALQEIFYDLSMSERAVSTKTLQVQTLLIAISFLSLTCKKSFGWDRRDA